MDEEHELILEKKYANGIQFDISIYYQSEKFLEYQKDLIEEFIADFGENLNEENYNIEEIKNNFEISLQWLNTKLKLFADKVRDVEYFEIKWFVQLIIDSTLITSMIWDVTLMIFRNQKLYYSLHNWVNHNAKIDLFSDFVEWDIELRDELIYVGTKVSDVLDDTDIKDMEIVLESQETPLLEFIEEVFSTRIDKANISFISQFVVESMRHSHTLIKNSKKTKSGRSISNRRKKTLLTNKYHVTIILLWVVILFMLYHVLSQLLNKTNDNLIIMPTGEQVDVTIEDIKEDIYEFKKMSIDNDSKSLKYHEIMDILNALESKWRWLEDVTSLRQVLQENYFDWFNIKYVTSLWSFDNTATNTTSKIFSFNNSEKDRLGSLLNIERWKNLMIAGSKWALIGLVNDGMRWALVEYGDEEDLKSCISNIFSNWLYCLTNNGNIFNITDQNGIEPITTASPGGFPSWVNWIWVWKNNIYLFQWQLDLLWDKLFATRYASNQWSQSQFKEWSNYRVEGTDTGSNLWSGFYSFTVDGNFLVRWSNGLYEFWRPDLSLPILQPRQIAIKWWDNISNTYSSDVKIIASPSSKYVYLFDSLNQTFTVYESRPQKNTEWWVHKYSLFYLFRFKFDLTDNKIVDAIVPSETGNNPILYLLSEDWVNKVDLYNIIGEITNTNQ